MTTILAKIAAAAAAAVCLSFVAAQPPASQRTQPQAAQGAQPPQTLEERVTALERDVASVTTRFELREAQQPSSTSSALEPRVTSLERTLEREQAGRMQAAFVRIRLPRRGRHEVGRLRQAAQAGGERFVHHAAGPVEARVRVAQHVTVLVDERRQQIHAPGRDAVARPALAGDPLGREFGRTRRASGMSRRDFVMRRVMGAPDHCAGMGAA